MSRSLIIRSAALLAHVFALSCSGSADLPTEAESGFKLETAAFSFENFGSDHDAAQLNARSLVRMFGAANVCVDGADPCVLTPNAQAWSESANEAMAEGHCEGFAVLSQLFHLGSLKPNDFGAATVRDLRIDENYKLQRELAYWFATQLVPEAAVNKALMPKEVVPFLSEFMKASANESYRIGMVQKDERGFGVAHSLTPIGFLRGENDKTYYIRVYDNNFPAQERQIRLDLETDTWTYAGVTSTGPIEFSGGAPNKNPLYFAATTSRTGELPCPFCASDSLNVIVAGAAPLVTDANGETGFKDGELVTAPNATMSPGFSLCARTGATVMVSSKNGASQPVSVVLAPNGMATQTLKIQSGSIGTITLRGDLASSSVGQVQATGDSVSIQGSGSNTEISLQVGTTVVTVLVTGDVGNIKVSRNPTTGQIAVETQDATGGSISLKLEDKQSGRKTEYNVSGGAGTETTTLDLPTEGWKSSMAPAAAHQGNGMSSPLAGSTCANLVKDDQETDLDCGGPKCGKCGAGKVCGAERDCLSEGCHSMSKTCVLRHTDGIKNGLESDIDCGGTFEAGAPRCSDGKSCGVRTDCVSGLGCVANVCRGYPSLYGSVTPAMAGVGLRLTPVGTFDNATANPERFSANNGVFSFPDTLILNNWTVEVTTTPPGYSCSVTSQGTRTDQQRVTGVRVTCQTAQDFCRDNVRNGQETDVDCGGATCTPLGRNCAVGSACLVDRDCGAPAHVAICASGTCRRTFNISGSASVTASVTLQLTPGGNLGGASDSPLEATVRPVVDNSFKFENTRVFGPYSVSVVPRANLTCTLSNPSGTATADVTDLALNCAGASCTNSVKDGTETDVDCGGTTCVASGRTCANGRLCSVAGDCASNVCTSGACAAPQAVSWAGVGVTFGGAGLAYSDASATSATDLWAAGGEDVANWDGASWTVVAKPFAGFAVHGLFAGLVGGLPHVWAGSTDNLIAEWDGTAWTARLTEGLQTTETINAIHGVTGAIVAVGSNGTVLRYDSLTENFKNEFDMLGPPPPTSANLTGVFVLSASEAWAVGAGGIILHYANGLWSSVTSGSVANLSSVWASSATDAWAAGAGGSLLRWNGTSWSPVASGTTSAINAIWGASGSLVWFVADGGLIRFWDGATWVTEPSGTTANLLSVVGAGTERWAMGANQAFVKRN